MKKKNTLFFILLLLPISIYAQRLEPIVSSIYEKDTLTFILTNTTNSTMQIYNQERVSDLSFSYVDHEGNYLMRNQCRSVFSYPIRYESSRIEHPDSFQYVKTLEIEPFKSQIFKFPLDSLRQKINTEGKTCYLKVACGIFYYIPEKKIHHNFVYRKFTFPLHEENDQVIVALTAPFDKGKIYDLIEKNYVHTQDSHRSNHNELITKKELPEPLDPDSVDILPEFPGGHAALMRYQRDIINLKYGYLFLFEHGVGGRAIIEFVIEEDGSITNPVVIRAVDPYLDRDALSIVSSMPKWKPGYNNGIPVRVKYRIPVVFRVQ